ncbi:MAG: hypothetical protein JNK79_02030 [Chitinophagaceae bacterium]|nr:hypothetical protein [Chitinophagaceae bacterium]
MKQLIHKNMKIKILRDSRVGEIKKQFNTKYPFLKLEFLTRRRLPKGPEKQILVSDNRKLSEIKSDFKEGAILVSDSTTVNELEGFFRNHLLDVQVFRRSNDLWLETTMTDSWSLVKQNSHGKEITESRHASRAQSRFDNEELSDIAQ